MEWICSKKVRSIMSNESLDKKKLNIIKLMVIKTEKDNIVKKNPDDMIVEYIRKTIERTVDGK